LFGFSAMMLVYRFWLGVLVIGLNVARLALNFALSKRMEELTTTEQMLSGRERATAVELFSLPESIRAFGCQEGAAAQYVDRMSQRMNATLSNKRYAASVAQLTAIFDAAASSCVLWVGGNAVIRHEMPIGVLVAFFALRLFIQKPLESLVTMSSSLRSAKGVSVRLADILATPTERRGLVSAISGPGAVELRQVSFAYTPGATPLVNDVSFAVAPGERLAIVGRIGSGKSTLARVMSGLIRPTSGDVLIDGRPLHDLTLETTSAHIGIALQEPLLIDASVYDNIALGQNGASLEAVRRAASIACLQEVIEALPEGYATRIGPGGARLSGGQRKRLALARAVLNQPRVLILDEVTASLDLATERRVTENLAAVGCTQIAITHRLSSIQQADRILVIDQGRIAEQGTYQSLAVASGLFRSLLNAPA
jgi:ATP-binding cassette subfamily B protein